MAADILLIMFIGSLLLNLVLMLSVGILAQVLNEEENNDEQ